jgi:hypothetical protein
VVSSYFVALINIHDPMGATVRIKMGATLRINALCDSALLSWQRIFNTRGPASHGGTFDPLTAST